MGAQSRPLVRPASARLPELLEDQLLVVGRDPEPVVGHCNLDDAVAHPRLDVDAAARRRELDGVRQQVEDDLPQPPLVGPNRYLVRVEPQSRAPLPPGSRALHACQCALQGRAQREGGEVQLHLSRLDLRQVEDVVDQEQQVAAGLEDVLDVTELALVQLAEQLLLQELGEADDGVQRRPQLVRHVGEELRLVPADGLELLVQPPKLVVHPVQVHGQRAELVAIRAPRRASRSPRRRSPRGAPRSVGSARAATVRGRSPAGAPGRRCRRRHRRSGFGRPCTTLAFCAIRASVCARVVVASWSVRAPRSLSMLIAGQEGRPFLVGTPVRSRRHDLLQRLREAAVVHADLAQKALVLRRGHEPETRLVRRRPELRERGCNRLVDEDPADRPEDARDVASGVGAEFG